MKIIKEMGLVEFHKSLDEMKEEYLKQGLESALEIANSVSSSTLQRDTTTEETTKAFKQGFDVFKAEFTRKLQEQCERK